MLQLVVMNKEIAIDLSLLCSKRQLRKKRMAFRRCFIPYAVHWEEFACSRSCPFNETEQSIISIFVQGIGDKYRIDDNSITMKQIEETLNKLQYCLWKYYYWIWQHHGMNEQIKKHRRKLFTLRPLQDQGFSDAVVSALLSSGIQSIDDMGLAGKRRIRKLTGANGFSEIRDKLEYYGLYKYWQEEEYEQE